MSGSGFDADHLRQVLQKLGDVKDEDFEGMNISRRDSDNFRKVIKALSTEKQKLRGVMVEDGPVPATHVKRFAFAREPLYPMYVMSVKDALELTEMHHHQELLRKGKVVRRTPGMIIIFVSHQWLGFSHPDKHMKQFRVLQQALRNLIGGMKVKMCPFTSTLFKQLESQFQDEDISTLGDAYIWYDFFCVPQLTDFLAATPRASLSQDHRKISFLGSDAGEGVDAVGKSMEEVQQQQRDAINSIPIYVQTCDHFFVCAPTESHDDTERVVSLETWGRRGWCRTEMGCHYFSPKDRPVVVCISKEDRIVETFPFAWLHNQPAQGEFSCEADRRHIKQVMATLCHDRIQYLRQKGRDFEPRFLTAMLPWLASGISPRAENLNDWLHKYSFSDHKEAGPLGWAPIHFAALEGNVAILDQLVDLGESVNRRTAAGDPPAFGTIDIGVQIPGMTPLMCAAFYIPTGADAVKVAQFLFEHRADFSIKAAGGETALHMASAGAASDGILVNYLIDNKADIECTNDASETPLVKACFFCPAGSKFPNAGHVQQLVRRGANLEGATSARPMQPSALRVAAGTSDVEAVEFLLTHRADVNGSRDYAGKIEDVEMSSLPETISKSYVKGSVQHLCGGTPLHWAAFYGNTKTVEFLLASGADPSRKNQLGQTAKDVAEKEAQASVINMLEKESACCRRVGCWSPWSL